MKVLFANSPVIRSEHSNASNNFKVDGFIFKSSLQKVPGSGRVFNYMNKIFGLGKGVRYGVRAGSRWPFTMDRPLGYAPFPFFMGYAAGLLQENGFEANIIDSVAMELYDYEKFFELVKAEKADIVVVECSTPTIDIDVWVAKRISEFTKVALAGPHLKDNAEKMYKEYPFITYFLKGEYIQNCLEMAQTQKTGIYESTVIKDLDSIPFPFRDFAGYDNYYDPSMPTAKPMLQIYSSKGCPFKCTFCSWPQNMYYGNVSLRSPEKIAEEIREAVKMHGYKSIFFDDDTFNLGTERISKLCDYLREIGLPWTMMGRLDVSPNWLYDKMVDSGCVGMRFGIETFDLDVLKGIKKGIERKDFRGTLEYISNTYPKVMIHLTMMKDMPSQSDEVHLNDMQILKDLGYVATASGKHDIYRNFQLSRCAPFPGTVLYDQMVEKVGKDRLEDYLKYDGGQDTLMKDIKLS